MTTLINKSTHPVNIKRINVNVWTLRDEIEAAIQKRMEETGSDSPDIQDIKDFYSSLIPRKQVFEPAIVLVENEDESEDGSPEEQPAMDEAPEGHGDDTQAGQMADELISEQENSSAASTGQNSAKKFTRVRPRPERIVSGFAFLSEVHMEQALFFSKQAFTQGQSVVIEFCIPNKFSVSAEVESATQIDRGSRIISESKPSHRVKAVFTYLFENERSHLRGFLRSVESSITAPPKKLVKAEDEGEEDEHDGMDY